MTRVMAELDQLATPVRARDIAAPVLARFSTDPARELSEQEAVVHPDLLVVDIDHLAYGALRATASCRFVTVVSAPPDQWDAVLVRMSGNGNAEAALEVAAQLAVARGVELVVHAGPRGPRRLNSTVDDLRWRQLVVRFATGAPPGSLVVVADGTDARDAHLTVRAELAPDRPTPDLARATE